MDCHFLLQNEAEQRLTEFCQENAKRIPSANSTRDNSTHGLHQIVEYENQIDYTLCRQRWRGSTQSAKMGPRADCDSDHELLIAKFRLKLKKVGKTTKPFIYDLNQIPYDYTVDMTNRFKGLDLIDRMPEELIWTGIHNIVQEAVIITIPKKKKCKKQNGCLRRPYK